MNRSMIRLAVIAIAVPMIAGRAAAQSGEPPMAPPPAPAAAPSRPALAATDSVPSGARARCRDGTFVTDQAVESSCAGRGGVAVRLSVAGEPVRAATPVAAPVLVPLPSRPSNATAQCRDGSFVTTTPGDLTCADRGGVAAIFPVPRTPPPRAP